MYDHEQVLGLIIIIIKDRMSHSMVHTSSGGLDLHSHKKRVLSLALSALFVGCILRHLLHRTLCKLSAFVSGWSPVSLVVGNSLHVTSIIIIIMKRF